MKVTIRKFIFEDIPKKIEWINNPVNNKFLHYDLPLEYEKTARWFKNNEGRIDRYDAVIEVDGIPVGLIGLLSIEKKNRKAEYYVSMGEMSYRGKGVAYQASKLILEYGFMVLGLNRIYLYTEAENIVAQKLFKKVGFKVEGLLKNDIFFRGRYVDRYVFGITKEDFLSTTYITPIQFIEEKKNKIYIKRDDMIPYSFGGNKARKGYLFFQEIDKGGYDSVVTYGSSHSNHCRIISNMAAARKIPCYLIVPDEVSDTTYNSRFMEMFEAEVIHAPLEKVHDTIENKLVELQHEGKNPYFIPGGGHGNIGTQAYVNCYDEIKLYEKLNHIYFDYIFLASGTGTTHAGLVCGQIKNGDERKIVGISIARKNPYGRNIVVDSIKEYMPELTDEVIQQKTIFLDDYIGEGYGIESIDIEDMIKYAMVNYGIPMDSTYTAKAFTGMKDYIFSKRIEGKNILFIHTGGTPLFFDDFSRM